MVVLADPVATRVERALSREFLGLIMVVLVLVVGQKVVVIVLVNSTSKTSSLSTVIRATVSIVEVGDAQRIRVMPRRDTLVVITVIMLIAVVMSLGMAAVMVVMAMPIVFVIFAFIISTVMFPPVR